MSHKVTVVCMCCHRVKMLDGSWSEHESVPADSEPSHGICDDCYYREYPEIYKKSHPKKYREYKRKEAGAALLPDDSSSYIQPCAVPAF